MNSKHLLNLMEEAAEVVKAAAKAVRFGPDSCAPPRTLSTTEALAMEVGDLLEIIDRLDLPERFVTFGRVRKARKLKQFGPGMCPVAAKSEHHNRPL